MSPVMKRLYLDITLPEKVQNDLWEIVNKEYGSCLESVKRETVSRIQKRRKIFEAPPADIFQPKGKSLFYYGFFDRPGLEAGAVLVDEEGESLFEGFCERIRKVLSGADYRGLLVWKEIMPANPCFVELKRQADDSAPVPGHIDAAGVLLDTSLLEFLREVAKRRRFAIADRGAKEAHETSMVDRLDKAGLLEKEYNVLCHETGQQISRLTSTGAFQEMKRSAFRCFECGRAISEENIKVWVSLSPSGKKLIDPHRWLGYLAYRTAQEAGFHESRIILWEEKKDGCPDIFLMQNDQMIMVEINEKSPDPGEIYLFSEKIKLYNPDHAVYLSLNKITPEIRRQLYAAVSCDLDIVQGIDDLKPALIRVREKKNEDYVSQTLARLDGMAEIKISGILADLFCPPSVRSGEELSPGEIREAEEFLEEEDKAEELASPAMPLLAEEETVSEELEELPEELDFLEEEVEIEEEIPEEEEKKAEPSGAKEKPGKEKLPAGLPEEEKKAKKTSADPVEDLIKHIYATGLSGLDEKMIQITGETGLSLALIDPLGFIIAQSVDSGIEAEFAGPLSIEIVREANRIISSGGFSPLQNFYLEGGAGFISCYVLKDFYITSWLQREEETAAAEETGKPGKPPLLKNILEDITKLVGMHGVLFVGRDGKLIDSHFREHLEEEILGHIFTQLLQEAEGHLETLELLPFKYMQVVCPEATLTVLPVKTEAFLAALQEPQLARDIYLPRLTEASSLMGVLFD
ncbi:MAG: roadblock/LC7 domain-containing protein [Chloroflexi bacterium]|nr:roadblock/LC7 domain-containing protein [Chloroflexota bacterium]